MTATTSLKARVLRAGGWALAGNFTGQFIRLASNLVVTRFVQPEAFGLVAVATVFMVGLAMLSDTGTTQALIRSPNGTQASFRATVWAVQAVRGCVLSVLCLLIAATLWGLGQGGFLVPGSTYAHPDLPLILAAYSVSPIIQGFTSTKVAMAQRALQLKYPVQVAIFSQVVMLPITVALAWHWQSVWALVVAGIASTVITTLMSHLLVPGERDRLGWNRQHLTELAGFGRWVMVGSIFGFMASNGDRVILSALIQPDLMGQYAIAFLIVGVLQTVFSLILGNVVFPAISEVARNPNSDLRGTYVKFQRVGDLVLGFGAAGLVVAGPTVIGLMYDHRYDGSGLLVSMLAAGTVGMRFQVLEQCYLALGKPAYMSYANGLRILTLAVGIPLAHHAAGPWAAIGVVPASQYSGWLVALWFCRSHQFPLLRAGYWLPLGLGAGGLVAWAFTWLVSR